MRSLCDANVVITGASSGIGRATAHAFARQGAHVALAARREAPLRELADACGAWSVRAIAVPTDVTRPDEVERLARTAAGAFGPIDIWVNNAGVGAVGLFTDTPIAAHRRVVETNLLGYIHGAHAALPHFFAQGHGVLINTISLGAWVPAPYAAAYAAGKWGLRGLSESLEAELVDWPDIHVCDVFPSFMNTPGIRHGANYTGRVLKPAPPVYDPQAVADTIVRLAQRPRRAATVGVPARLAHLGGTVAPRLAGWVAMRVMQFYFRRAEEAPVTDGNLFEPMPHGTGIHGGWRSQNRPLLFAGLALAGAAAGALVPAVRRLRR
ncbi:SDR family oxidoreductase [Rhodospirillaceae bacterium SYSU D60014]|uniref:SDR family oxidoreductase n=1 Tax=Virgifigura deserti TaxID=2268457 RepID=UPI000E670667